MRKSLVALALLLALAVTALAAVPRSVDSRQNAVTVTEVARYGDPAAAAGLTLRMGTNLQSRLFWETSFAAGGATDAETVFSYAGKRVNQETSFYDRTGYLYSNGPNFGTYGTTLKQMREELEDPGWSGLDYAPPMYEPVLDVASRTKIGETRTETVPLNRYYDTYTLCLDTVSAFHTGTGSNASLWLDDEAALVQQFRDCFPVPVPDEAMVEVTVTRYEDGTVDADCTYAVEVQNLSGVCLPSENGIYLAFSVYGGEEAIPLDLSGFREGFGLYYLPVELVPEAERPARDDTDYVRLAVEKLENIYPMDPARMEGLELLQSPDGERLLLLTHQDGRGMLTVLRASDGALLQELTLPFAEGNGSLQREDLLLLRYEEGETRRLLVLQWEDGAYRTWVDAVLPFDQEMWYNWNWSTVGLDFDGTRLSLLSARYSRYDCRADLLVLDRTGLLYWGDYSHTAEHLNEKLWRQIFLNGNGLTVDAET